MEQDTARQGDSFLSRRTLASICYTSLVRNMTTAMMHGGDIGPDQNIRRTRCEYVCPVRVRVCVCVYVSENASAGCSAIDGTEDHRTI